ncbi:hypothetical protein [Segniliparus rugosus]|uniref:Uncharacterized protein n=1 Tax=Segniliparus rugosus (strain ATCC BAA-974 / DSM 45345 / CCUG 50838 / CIP 108380 / JCM 13579 / CDC 945) TaxID=679197 RepID=E5XQX0_SEGRC|nr:hypothetical protein [Segniliparus rugosus]EFV13261.1 hypothetical protein HMPREF9336_01923 [Segniliparus rugosus ATCC BAA-974]
MSEDDQLRADEIQPTGGWIRELLTEEGESLWSLRVECRAVERPYGSTPLNVEVDCVDFGLPAGDGLAGAEAVLVGDDDEPSASVYFFEHYAYDRAVVRVLSRQGERARVSVELAEDLYGLGLERISLTAEVEVVPAVRAVSSSLD